MSVSEILVKIADGQPITPAEREFLRMETANIDRAAKLINSWTVPGTTIPFIRDLQTSNVRIDSGEIQLGSGTVGDGFSGVRIGYPAFSYNSEDWNIAGVDNDTLQVGIRASDGKFVAGGGNVLISEGGIVILEGVGQSFLSFYDETGTTEKFAIKVAGDGMDVQSLTEDGIMLFRLTLPEETTPSLRWSEDEAQTNRTYLELGSGSAHGSRLVMQGTTGGVPGGLLDFRTEGVDGGSTFLRVMETSRTPPDSGDDAFHLYIKNNKLVVQFNDAGTLRYKYLDLTGTGATWTHSTSAP